MLFINANLKLTCKIYVRETSIMIFANEARVFVAKAVKVIYMETRTIYDVKFFTQNTNKV